MLEHVPVMLDEVINFLPSVEGGVYADATFGAGGYTKKILHSIKNSRVIGIDTDPSVEKFSEDVLKDYHSRFKFINRNNVDLKNIASELNISSFDGIVFDLGVSSMQLETPERGFSFMRKGVLDMRMGETDLTAADIVNNFDESDIADIIYFYGEDPKAKKIARAIIKERNKKQILTTNSLADIVKSVNNINKGLHPATKTFQALRIFVNNELKNVEKALLDAVSLLSKRGVLVVVSFHSLEDRIVKRIFKHFALQHYGEKKFGLLTKKPITPSDIELSFNNRARSAKLRALFREF